MGTKDVRWEKYPAVVPADRAGRWLDMQANLGLAPNTMDRARPEPCSRSHGRHAGPASYYSGNVQ